MSADAAGLALPGELAARYSPLRLLGEGGYGRVILAEDTGLNRLVAVKLLHAAAGDPALTERFQREALLTSNLAHPHVVQVYDHGVAAEGPYIIYEYVAGPSLRSHLDAGARPTPEQVVTWGQALGDALACAHRAGVVHRDVKPENVLLRDDTHPVLCDFGVARPDETGSTLTAEGIILGTPGYLAPEIWLGRPPSPASDQFALAATLWELLTGGVPYGSQDTAEILQRVSVGFRVELPPSARPLPGALQETLARALAHEPLRRFPDTAAFVAALDAPGTRGTPRAGIPAPPVSAPDTGVTVMIAPAPDADPNRTPERLAAPPQGFRAATGGRGASPRRREHCARAAIRRSPWVPLALSSLAALALAGLWLAWPGDAPVPDPTATAIPAPDLEARMRREREEAARRLRERVRDDLDRLATLHPGPLDPILASEVRHAREVREGYVGSGFLDAFGDLLDHAHRWLVAESDRGEPLAFEEGRVEVRILLRRLHEDLHHHVRDLYLLDFVDTLDPIGSLAGEAIMPRYRVALRETMASATHRGRGFVRRLREDFPAPSPAVLSLECLGLSLLRGEDHQEEADTQSGVFPTTEGPLQGVLRDLEGALEEGGHSPASRRALARATCRLLTQVNDIGLIRVERRAALLVRVREQLLSPGQVAENPVASVALVDLLRTLVSHLRVCDRIVEQESTALLRSVLGEIRELVEADAPPARELRAVVTELARTERGRLSPLAQGAREPLLAIQELDRALPRMER